MNTVSEQSRLLTWRTCQAATRAALKCGLPVGDGIVASALEEEVMRLLGIHPHPVWEAGYDGWLLIGPMLPGAATKMHIHEPPPYPGRRVEIKARRDGVAASSIGVDLSRCDDLVFVRWRRTRTSPISISGEIRYVPDIATAFGERPIHRTTFGIAQIEASHFDVLNFTFA